VFALLAHSSVQKTATSAPIQQVAFLTECVIHNQLVPHINEGEFPIQKTRNKLSASRETSTQKREKSTTLLFKMMYRIFFVLLWTFAHAAVSLDLEEKFHQLHENYVRNSSSTGLIFSFHFVV
jgi:hypothetical protein